jgi:hypothetical protein
VDFRRSFDRERHPYRHTLLWLPAYAAFIAVVLSAVAGEPSAFVWLFPLKLIVYAPILIWLTWVNSRSRGRAPQSTAESGGPDLHP